MADSIGIVKRRALWSAVLGLAVVVLSSAFLDSSQIISSAFGVEISEPSYTSWVFATYLVSFASWSGAAYASISLLNVVADLVSKRGVNDQIVGVVGGFLFWFGVDILNLILYPLAIRQLSMEFLRIEVLGVGALLSVVGLALMVKG